MVIYSRFMHVCMKDLYFVKTKEKGVIVSSREKDNRLFIFVTFLYTEAS